MTPNLRLLRTRMLLPAALLALCPVLTGAEGQPAVEEADLTIVNANDEPVTLTEQKILAPFNRRNRRNAKDFHPAEPAKVAYGSGQWTLEARKAASISLKEANSPVYVFDLTSLDGAKKVKLAIDCYGHKVTLLDAMDIAELHEHEAEHRFEISWKRPARIELPVSPQREDPAPLRQTALSAALDQRARLARATNGWKPGLMQVNEEVPGFGDTGMLSGLKGPEPKAMTSLKDRLVGEALRGSVAPERFNARTLAAARESGRQARGTAAKLEIRRKKDAARHAREEARRSRQQQLEAEAASRATEAPAQTDQPTINADVLAMFS